MKLQVRMHISTFCKKKWGWGWSCPMPLKKKKKKKKKTHTHTWREYSGQRVKSWSFFFTGVGSNPMPIFLFLFLPIVTLKIITSYPIVNLTTSNFDFIFHKLAKFTNIYSHSSSKVISKIMGLIHWMCNLGAAHLHVYQPCFIFSLFLHHQSSFSLNVLWI